MKKLTADFGNKKAETASFCFLLIYVIPFRLINNRSELVVYLSKRST
ncbi:MULTISPECIES: hypothetical protein [Vibrio]|uniref:Uncharacterized protein n=2 Tax=Vibrio cyclitrophicus TaxID=47951 RepID=A0ACD5G1G2_9VIBR|nr:hypothetical protein [Vibrio cyclitrophicus]ERM58076.1 hypothetical protein M565_ctg5P1047 [Vibrio cyclitrophicus FF75]|tara:strand:+ start:107 stop:247 length:141 start_codon:yes stop_codon:yes gene_type:complete